MLHSQNGYAVDPGAVATYTVPGTDTRLTFRRGDVAVVMLWVAHRFNTEVEPIDAPPGGVMDDWSRAIRNVRDSVRVISNHGSATAEDLNATKHPRGVAIVRTFSPSQIAACKRIEADSDGVVRWGGSYLYAPPDGMHFEVNRPPAQVAALAKKIRAGKVPGSWPGFPAAHRPQEDDMPAPTQVNTRWTGVRELARGVWCTPNMTKSGPSILAGPATFSGDVGLTLEQLIPDATVQVRAVVVRQNKKGGPWEYVRSLGIDERRGTTGQTFVRLPVTGRIVKGERLRVQVTTTGGDGLVVTTDSHLNVWKG